MNRSPNPIDIHVDSLVRLKRMMIGMSPEMLGGKLNLTFQQVEKYEKGANRIGASRLFTIASILEVPVQFFFKNMAHDTISGLPLADGSNKEPAKSDYVMGFVGSREGLELNKAFSKITEPKRRKAFVELVKSISDR